MSSRGTCRSQGVPNRQSCSQNLIRVDMSNKKSVSTKALPNVMLLNARSIFNKINELTIQVGKYKSDIIFATETWLTENIPDEAIPIPGFNLFRKERPSGKGGGVAIYVNNGFPIKIRNDICNQSFECLWLTLRTKWLPRSIPRIAVAWKTSTTIFNPATTF